MEDRSELERDRTDENVPAFVAMFFFGTNDE